jgi:hypothetical protein
MGTAGGGGMNILLCLSHSIEEYDQLKLLSELGYGVASIGGYIDPAHPHDPKRPALDVPMIPAVKNAVDTLGTPDNLGAAQSNIPDAILDWLGDDGVIIYHHYLDRLYGQWPHILDWKKGSPRRRVIWRSVGQSVEGNERTAQPFRAQGLERIAYSPKEANIPGYSGHDALIRFYKDPDEYGGWVGDEAVVLNIAQHHDQPHGRDVWLNWRFWEQATQGLPAVFAGTHSEKIGGLGQLDYDTMKEALRRARAYLYTGTQPASYTLGLIEAMMVGIPVVSIGPSWMRVFPYGSEMFEGHEIAGLWSNDELDARDQLKIFLREPEQAAIHGMRCRYKAIELFGKDRVKADWKAYLG